MNIVELVDEYGVTRTAKMKNISERRVRKLYLNERDGVGRKRRPHKPKVKR